MLIDRHFTGKYIIEPFVFFQKNIESLYINILELRQDHTKTQGGQ
jgi:hypothetical protein